MHLEFLFKNYTDNPNDKCASLMTTVSTHDHRHMDFYEIILITCGGYFNIYNGVSTLYKKNSLLFFRPGTIHSIILSEPNSTHFTFLVSEAFMEKAFEMYLPASSKLSECDFYATSLTYTQANYLYPLTTSMINMQTKDKSHLHTLFLHNVLYLLFSALPAASSVSEGDYIDTLIERLNNFYYLNTDISSIYLDYPIAQSTLCAAFKKRTGTTIVNYRNSKKMEYAAQMLSDWNYNITDVASKINISCLSYFSKQFKAQFGISPKKYQKIHRNPFPKDN